MLHLTPDDVWIDRVLPLIGQVPLPFIQSEEWQAKAEQLWRLVVAMAEPDRTTAMLIALSFAFHAGWAARDLKCQVGNN